MKTKTKLLSFISLFLIIPLAGCSQTKWSWWETENLTIEKGILLSDAQAALDSSSANSALVRTRLESYSYNTYYKDYLGSFATESDSNITTSSSTTTNRYNNDVVVATTNSTNEQLYLKAKSYSAITLNVYLVGQSDKTIFSRSIYDYGYGNKIGSDIVIPYTSDEMYEAFLNIGSVLKSTNITWSGATYGFAKNDEVIIETMSTYRSEYTVKFNGQVLSAVTNVYNMYRLNPTYLNDIAIFVMDYAYRRTEVLVGTDIVGEPLDKPFTLEYAELTTAYKVADMGDYDVSTIPVIEEN